MTANARVGDQASMNCPEGATGTITSGSPNIIINGHACARVGDTITCNSCGTVCHIVSGSPDAMGNGEALARIGDTATGTCIPTGASISPTITTGSPNMFTD